MTVATAYPQCAQMGCLLLVGYWGKACEARRLRAALDRTLLTRAGTARAGLAEYDLLRSRSELNPFREKCSQAGAPRC
jgi:hypothetical protein